MKSLEYKKIEFFAPNQAVKHDEGKIRFDLLPVDSLEDIANCFNHGTEKYGPRSWETHGKVEYSRLYAAILRHLFSWWNGEDKDTDSGLDHLAHVATNAAMLLSYSKREESDLDDRPMPTKKVASKF